MTGSARRQGLFITLEGGEGCGKTTQIALLLATLKQKNIPCITTREPGGTPAGEALRSLLTTGSADRWSAVSETLLFQAARVEHVERVIKPALAEGKTVLCDRFLDSTLVYQGIAKGLGMEYVRELHQMSLGNFQPHHTFVLDIDPAIGLKRAGARTGNETRFESMDEAFHASIRAGFLALANANAGRYTVIDANQALQMVQAQLAQKIAGLLAGYANG